LQRIKKLILFIYVILFNKITYFVVYACDNELFRLAIYDT